MKAQGFLQSAAEPCIYVRRSENEVLFLGLFVDDLLLCSSSPTLRKRTAEKLSERYLMKDMGAVTTYLGMELKCTEDGISLSQSAYIAGILDRFGMTNAKVVSTPAIDFPGDLLVNYLIKRSTARLWGR